jgi:uncharacterized protein (TIGR02118 family)
MTVKLRATWTLPPVEAADDVERAYRESHRPLVRGLDGLRRHNVLRFLRDPKGGPPLWWRGEELYFENVAALDSAAASPAWAECWSGAFGDHVGGPRIYVFDVEEEFTPTAAPAETAAGETTALSGIWQVPAAAVPATVDPIYLEVHVPGVRALPRLQRHTVMRAIDWPDGEHSRAWRSAEIRFDSLADFDSVFDTPQYDGIRRDGFNASIAGPDVDIYAVEEEWRP